MTVNTSSPINDEIPSWANQEQTGHFMLSRISSSPHRSDTRCSAPHRPKPQQRVTKGFLEIRSASQIAAPPPVSLWEQKTDSELSKVQPEKRKEKQRKEKKSISGLSSPAAGQMGSKSCHSLDQCSIDFVLWAGTNRMSAGSTPFYMMFSGLIKSL